MTLYINIEDTINNNDYRRVINTTQHNQVVLMSLAPGEDIPMETHDGPQFIRVEQGQGLAVIDGQEYKLINGVSINIPAGVEHYIKQIGNEPLKLYAIYSPAEHDDGMIQPRQVSYIEQLPADVLRLTYGHLDDADLARACLVNKDFNEKLCNSKAWIRRILDDFPLTLDEINKYRGNNNYASYYLNLKKNTKFPPKYEMMTYVRKNRPDLVLIALRLGEVDLIRYSGFLPTAVRGGNKDIIKTLLDAGVNPNIYLGRPLRIAAYTRRLDIMKMLLDAGADPHIMDNHIFNFAQQEEFNDVLELLNQYSNNR